MAEREGDGGWGAGGGVWGCWVGLRVEAGVSGRGLGRRILRRGWALGVFPAASSVRSFV